MISQTGQRLAMGALGLVAVGALALGALYQDDDKLGDARVVGAGTTSSSVATGGGIINPNPPASTAGPQAGSGPIEAWLPRSGEASACSEAIGVDLAPGYGAELTINGIEIAPEAMNVNLDDSGGITDEITASRSLGQYTFQADDNCPNGRFLRPVDNVLEACVYRLSDESRSCAVRREHIFDAL